MYKILITGGTFFLESQLFIFFHKKNYDIHLLDNISFGYKDNNKFSFRIFKKANNLLGWQPQVSFDQGIISIIEYARNIGF